MPVPGVRAKSGRHALIWFAKGDDGSRYAVTATLWRGLERDQVLRVAPGTDPAAALGIGNFAAVVAGWLAPMTAPTSFQTTALPSAVLADPPLTFVPLFAFKLSA